MRGRLALFALVALAGIAVALQLWRGGDEPAWRAHAPAAEDGLTVLIFGRDEAGETDEADADWAAYLEDFREDRPEASIRFAPPETCRALTAADACNAPYTTLFLNAEGEALLYEGRIVEPQVYGHAAAALLGGEMTPELRAFAAPAVEVR